MIKVRIVEQGGAFKEVSISEGSTVETALEAAGARVNVHKDLRVNNEQAELDDIVENNDTIYSIPEIAGN
jgi:hypothetical protein